MSSADSCGPVVGYSLGRGRSGTECPNASFEPAARMGNGFDTGACGCWQQRTRRHEPSPERHFYVLVPMRDLRATPRCSNTDSTWVSVQ